MDLRDFHHRLYEAARRLIPRRSGIICAVSGGADSVAMLHGLDKVREIHDCGWRIAVAHLDHRLRPESGEDAAFVRDLAAGLGLEFMIEDRDIAREAEASGRSIEEAARHARYEFLGRCAERSDAAVIAVAHHADDQAETILHHMLRGTGLRGLAGMRESRPAGGRTVARPEGRGSCAPVTVVRPMLTFCRADLAAYLRDRKLEYREDATNADHSAATRNRLRHVVLPMLEECVRPGVVDALVSLGRHARRAHEVIRCLAEEFLQTAAADATHEKCILSARRLAALPDAVRTEAIMLAIQRLGAAMGRIDSERLEAVDDLVQGDGGRRVVELPDGVVVERRGDVLTIVAALPVPARRDEAAVADDAHHGSPFGDASPANAAVSAE